jgi:DNA-binding response OmpR family regulator
MDSLLVLAKPDADQERILSAIASASRLELVTCNKVEAAVAWLDAHEPRVVVFDASLVRAEKLCHKVRSKKDLANVPLIALTSDTSDTLIERLYSLGADDVMTSTLGPGFMARLKTLPDRLAQPPARGLCVVADSDRERCNVVARVLANAGYDVKLAHDPVSLAFYTKSRMPRLVVGSANLGPPRSFITEARRRGCTAPWIVTATRRDLVKVAGGLAGLTRVSVVNTAGAPETVLFVANEMMRGQLPPTRGEERQLYNTLVRFRSAREETDELGFSYNISPNGMFVRTLAAPEHDSVWLEVRPPRSREWVRLEGRVVWRRAYVPTSAQLGPPGFGVAITGGLGDCLSVWKANCETFAQSMQASATNIAKLHTTRREDARTSGEYMLLEVPSESRLAVVSVVSDASTLPLPSVPTPPISESSPPPRPPTEPPPRSISDPAPSPVLPLSDMPPLTSVALPPDPPLPGSATLPLSDMPPLSAALPSPDPPAVEDELRDMLPSAPPPPFPLEEERQPRHKSVPPEELPAEDLEPALEAQPPPPPVRSSPPIPPTPRVRQEPEAFSLTRPRTAEDKPKRRRASELSSIIGFLAVGLIAGGAAAVFYPTTTPSSRGSSAPRVISTPSAPPAVSASALPSTSAPPLATAPPVDLDVEAQREVPDPGKLDWSDGYLVVRSSSVGDVYSTGFKIGTTNQPNKTRCGLRWVRIGSGEPPHWVSEGLTVDVKCQAVTTIDLEQSP